MVVVIYTTYGNFGRHFNELVKRDYINVTQSIGRTSLSKIILGSGTTKLGYNKDLNIKRRLVDQLKKVYSFLARKINKVPISRYYLTISEEDGITVLRYKDLVIYINKSLGGFLKRLGDSKETYSLIPIKIKGEEKYIYITNANELYKILEEMEGSPRIIVNKYMGVIGFRINPKTAINFRDNIVKLLVDYYKRFPRAARLLLNTLDLYKILLENGKNKESVEKTLKNLLKNYLNQWKANKQNLRLSLS